ncbi:radical SAM protein [bacterium]|nr:radical SAM protein [bacterium]
MANIVVTNKCNLKCPYCFASEVVQQETEMFTVENFIKALNFIKTRKNERVGLVGGEPTIHSKFGDFTKIIQNDNEITNCIIYTNGIELAKYIEIIKHDKFTLLLNCNAPYNIGNLYNKLEETITILAKEKKNRFNLGINIYKPDMDYSYIFDLLKLSKTNYLRYSISISNAEKAQSSNKLDYYRKFIPIITNFYKDCLKRDIIPSLDCNGIPICLTNNEIKQLQLEIFNIVKEKRTYCQIIGNPCPPSVDILPDLTAVRSICFPYNKSVPIYDFRIIDMLTEYFINEIDSNFKSLFISEECKTCKYKQKEICGVCPTFAINEFYEIKKQSL